MNTLTGIIYVSTPERDFTSTRTEERPTQSGPLLDYRAQMVIAYRHYLDKSYTLALSTYRRVLADYPADATALSGEAWSLYYLGDEDRAAVDFRTLLHANSADSWARKGLALCERREGE
jgi:tetratricopeptide (TPR) repeat protein